MDLSTLPEDTRAVLERHRFDAATFDELRGRLATGSFGAESNRLKSEVLPPPEGSWSPLPEPGTAEREELAAVGRQAIAAGRVGVVVLNGGMATRFGGVVKCAVPVLDGRSFLDLKLADIARSGQGKAWAILMNSFATDAATAELLGELAPDCPVRTFTQSVMPRVRHDGELFLDAEGRPSLAAPGHGDLTDSLRASGVLAEFREAGGDMLMMVNVDNLGATLDPAIIGSHLGLGGQMTVEVVDKDPGDAGGAPALVDGRVQIVEGFRFPADFDQDSIPVFNTNTFVFDAAAIDGEQPLTWFAVNKKVGGEPVVQFERLAGELSAILDSRYVHVPRRGEGSRFLPAKDPQELERRQGAVRAALVSRGVLSS